jgi:fatty acid desaturase
MIEADAMGSERAERRVLAEGFGAEATMGAQTAKVRFFAHSNWDAAMVTVTLMEIALTAFATVTWGHIPLLASLSLGAGCVVLNCLNYQAVAHSFIHHPFFTSRLANRIFSVLSSLALQAPQTLYRAHHLDHHRYNNDPRDATTGRTQDSSSTYRYSREPGREEHVVPYAMLGPLRVDYGHYYGWAKKRGDARLMWIETVALFAYLAALGLANWRGLVLFFLPVFYLGQSAALAHNYCEHRGATPGDRLRDSVSCYGWLYNKLWFNEGYHQEHHFRPHVHWTKLPELRSSMVPESERRVVRHIHWLNALR